MIPYSPHADTEDYMPIDQTIEFSPDSLDDVYSFTLLITDDDVFEMEDEQLLVRLSIISGQQGVRLDPISQTTVTIEDDDRKINAELLMILWLNLWLGFGVQAVVFKLEHVVYSANNIGMYILTSGVQCCWLKEQGLTSPHLSPTAITVGWELTDYLVFETAGVATVCLVKSGRHANNISVVVLTRELTVIDRAISECF